MNKGYFISLEGIDGCGKTTLLQGLVRALGAEYDILQVREPGGTGVSEQIRSMLLDACNQGIMPRTEALLYAAARAQLVDQILRPALAARRLVIADRYMDSTMAYQGYGRGLELEFLKVLNQICTGGVVPNLTILLDLDPQEALRRCRGDIPDRLEAEGQEFQARVREGYLRLQAEQPERMVLMDALSDESVVLDQALSIIRERIEA